MLLFLFILLPMAACSAKKHQNSDSEDGDSNSDLSTDFDSDGYGDTGLVGNTWYDYDKYQAGKDRCGEVVLAVFRDFTSEHPDFERINLGWGPLQGVLDDELNSDKKPQMIAVWGENQVVDSSCQETCPEGGDLNAASFVSTASWAENWATSSQNYEEYEPPPPMYDGISSFKDWYTDVDGVNVQVKKWLSLKKESDGTFVFDSNRFFPIGDDEGLGAEAGQMDASGESHNFLFTTELHQRFTYSGGEKFTFRGDDDLWIFVNNKLALDLGGMHWPFEGTIDFDQKAKELGITKGQEYDMDIYHAERHTEASNFRIETNIDCFIVVE